MATISYRAPLELLTANAIWAVAEMLRKSFILFFLCIDSLAESDSSEACGGPSRLSVYTSTGSVTAYPIPTVQTIDLPGNWQYSRCLACVYCLPVTTQRLLTLIRSEPGAIRVFPYQVLFPYNNSAQNCLTQCSTFGYPAAGMENGDECCMFYCNGTFTRSLT